MAALNGIDEIKTAVNEAIQEERQQLAPALQSAKGLQKNSASSATLRALNRNADGDAELLVGLYTGKFAYDHAEGWWYKWRGHYWTKDLIGEVLQAIDNVGKVYEIEAQRQSWLRMKAAKEGDKEAAKKHQDNETALLKRIHLLRTLKRKQEILILSRSGHDTLGITGNEWDRDPWLLAVANGVIDLKTGELRPGKPEDFLKTAAPTPWEDLDTPCPTWDRFLSDVFRGNRELINFVQQLLGYGITGLSIHHYFPIFYGRGRNGKGTLLETIRQVLGDYAMKTEAEILLEQKHARQAGAPNSGVLALRGRRLVWASETSDGRRLNAGRLKELVGGDTLNARGVFSKRHVQFRPSHLLVLLTNSRPTAPASDYALWQRILLIPFEQSFVNNPRASNESLADPYLSDKLMAEGSGILAWLVRGCLEWQKVGLSPPDIVRAATEDYKKEEDILGNFIDECCTLSDSRHVRAKTFYEAYKRWATENGLKELSAVAFGREMKKRFDSHPDSAGIAYIGVSVEG